VKDSEILQLKEEKAATEIALKAALEEKSSVDKALENLRGDMGKVEKSFRSMKQDLNSKSAELDKIQMEKNSLLVKAELQLQLIFAVILQQYCPFLSNFPGTMSAFSLFQFVHFLD
jgi:Tfp pilus assembly protein PilO